MAPPNRQQWITALRGTAWTLGIWLLCVLIGFVPQLAEAPLAAGRAATVTTVLSLALLPLTIAGMALARGNQRRGLVVAGVVVVAVGALTLNTLFASP